MERPIYHYPTNTPALRIPAGYVAVPLEDYRKDIERITVLTVNLKLRDGIINLLEDVLKDMASDLDVMAAQLEEFDAFFADEPYAVTILERWRDEKKKKDEEEAKNAEAEDS